MSLQINTNKPFQKNLIRLNSLYSIFDFLTSTFLLWMFLLCLLQHYIDYVTRLHWCVFFFGLYYQVHIFHLTAMLRASRNDVNPCSVNIAVTKDVSKLCNVFFYSIKSARKQMAKIMRKHFLWINICILAQSFHFSPNVRAVYRLAASRHKNHAAIYSLIRRITEQFLL